jgi:copper chaperone CopZ
LERLPGVKQADVKLETGQARVIYDDTKQTPEKLAAAIDMLGFKAALVTVADAPNRESSPSKR